jgi:hypothetical protein
MATVRVKASYILTELLRRRVNYEKRYQEKAKRWEFLIEKYEALPWWKKWFASNPADQWYFLGFSGEEYEAEHSNLFRLCEYAIARTGDGMIELPFEYSYLLPK